MKNKKKEEDESGPLTIEKLRTFPGFSEVTDEQAMHIINSLDEIADVIYECEMHHLREREKKEESKKSD